MKSFQMLNCAFVLVHGPPIFATMRQNLPQQMASAEREGDDLFTLCDLEGLSCQLFRIRPFFSFDGDLGLK